MINPRIELQGFAFKKRITALFLSLFEVAVCVAQAIIDIILPERDLRAIVPLETPGTAPSAPSGGTSSITIPTPTVIFASTPTNVIGLQPGSYKLVVQIPDGTKTERIASTCEIRGERFLEIRDLTESPDKIRLYSVKVGEPIELDVDGTKQTIQPINTIARTFLEERLQQIHIPFEKDGGNLFINNGANIDPARILDALAPAQGDGSLFLAEF